MDLGFVLAGLERNAGVFKALATGLGPEQARWKPTPERWSVLEVVCHLADEEREDFRPRLDLTLHHPDQAWPPINPKAAVSERDYNSRELPVALEDFLTERQRSLAWLATLESRDWTLTRQQPWGQISAGDLLVSWLTHDFIHIRQINRLHRDFAVTLGEPYSSDYAGDW